MFTGIVAELGSVSALAETDTGQLLTIDAGASIRGLEVGDSVAVNGVCLTAVAISSSGFDVEVVRESLDRSNLGDLRLGDHVDLERPMEAGGRFDGHIVQGHVDGVGEVAQRVSEGEAERVRFTLPADLGPYVVEKGSITVDGVSLTVTAVAEVGEPSPWFEVVLIPHTLEATVLGRRRVGDRVNLEADVIAKYVERLLEART